jgi:hypothetical protein
MKRKLFLIVAIFSVIFLWGCYPEGPQYTEDLDIVVTNHNPDYNFAAKGTYAMPDRIVKITGNMKEGDNPEFIPDATATQIIAKIASNMENLGWKRVAVGASPDVLLTPAELESTTVMYYYDYWYWWYGNNYPYWGYNPPAYYDSYITGTLLMSIIDKSELAGNGAPVRQWTGLVNGILSGKYSPERVNHLIDKAFDQSSYLKTN